MSTRSSREPRPGPPLEKPLVLKLRPLGLAPVLPLGGLAAGLLLALAAAADATSHDRPPSLVLVTIDTLRADRLGCYGYHRQTSPTLDAFAEEALLFERAYTTMATTLPAHASLMTGTHPVTHGVQANVAHLPRTLDDALSLRTLAEMLSDRGYQTAGFVSAAPLKRHSGIDRGFATFSQPTLWQRRGDATVRRALRWLEREPARPFFLWVHLFDPHWPYSPPREQRRLFRPTPELSAYLQNLGVPAARSRKIQRVNNAYDGEVRFADQMVDLLFDRLRLNGDWSGSVIVVTSDHGEGLGQHDYLYHGRIYNEQLRVPLLIKPARPGGARRIGRVTSLVDILPILDAVTELPFTPTDRAQFQGADTSGREPQRPGVLSERVHREGSWGPGRRYALSGPEWKYLHSPEGEDALYHLRSDPHEIENVLELHPEVARALLADLSETLRAHAHAGPGAEPASIDQETLEQLRALGYVD